MTPNTEHKRYAKNFVVFAPMQTRMSYYFVAFAICLIGVMMFLLNHYLGAISDLISLSPGVPLSTQKTINSDLQTLLTSSFVFLGFSLIISVIYGIIISHRIAGPMMAIIKYIESLRGGRYEEQRKLRPYDELMPIMNALHGLGDDLKKKR